MSSTTLYRLSGISLLVGSLLGVIWSILNAVLYPGHQETAQQILSFPWMLVASLYLAGYLLLALGLPGMYRRQAARTGGWGVVGFVLILVSVLMGGVLLGLIQIATMPHQAQSDPGAVSQPPPAAAFVLFVTIPVLLVAVGAILLGIASLRARVFPRGAGVLLLVSGIIALVSLAVPSAIIETILEALWNGVFFLAFGWFGSALVAQGKERVMVPARATPIAQSSREA